MCIPENKNVILYEQNNENEMLEFENRITSMLYLVNIFVYVVISLINSLYI